MSGQHATNRAGLHDNVLDRPSAKEVFALLGANWRPWRLKIKPVSIPQKVGCAEEVVTLIWDISASGLSCTRLADFGTSLNLTCLFPPKGGLRGRSCHPNLRRQCLWAELHALI